MGSYLGSACELSLNYFGVMRDQFDQLGAGVLNLFYFDHKLESLDSISVFMVRSDYKGEALN